MLAASRSQTFATRISVGLARDLDRLCRRFGLRKNFVVETALREKIEDLLDAAELKTAVQEAVAFHPWNDVKKDLRRKRRK
jgi:hypothetical protein